MNYAENSSLREALDAAARYILASNLPEAEKILLDLHRQYPVHAEVLIKLGEVYIETGNYKVAQECYFKLVELTPTEDRYFFVLGCLSIKLGQINQAKSLLEQSIRLNPGASDSRFMHASLYDKQGGKAISLNTDLLNEIKFKSENINMVIPSKKASRLELDKPVFFYHIPKTAGLTFRYSILAAQICTQAVENRWPDQTTAAEIFDWKGHYSKDVFSRRYTSIIAWKPFGFHKNFVQDFNLVAVVRDPFDRIVSRFKYFSLLKTIESTEERFVDFFRAEPQRNHQCKLLSGGSDTSYSNPDLLNRAIENTKEFYAIVTIFEIEPLIQHVLSIYDLPNIVGQRVNVARAHYAIDFKKYKQEILEINKYDKQLFEFVEKN